MADTERDLTAILALYADNTTKLISPQDARDMIVSAFGGYGSIRALDAAAAFTAGTTPLAVDQTVFAADGPSSTSVTPDSTTDGDITVVVPGDYRVDFAASYTAPVSRVIQHRIRVGGVEQTIGCQLVGTGGLQSVSCGDVLTLALNDVVTVFVESDQAATGLTYEDVSLAVKRVG